MLAESVTDGVRAVGEIVTPIAVAYIAYISAKTHKAVNSTALALAEVAKAKDRELASEQDKNSLLSADVARLRAVADEATRGGPPPAARGGAG